MNRSLIIAVVIGLALFVLGGGLGVFYQTQKDVPQSEKDQAMEAVIKSLSSEVIPSIIAYGQVIKIEGKDITLSYGGDSIKVSMAENSPVFSFINDAAGKSVQKEVEFKEIKIKDNLNISIKLLPDGRLEGQSVVILSPFSNPVKAK